MEEWKPAYDLYGACFFFLRIQFFQVKNVFKNNTLKCFCSFLKSRQLKLACEWSLHFEQAALLPLIVSDAFSLTWEKKYAFGLITDLRLSSTENRIVILKSLKKKHEGWCRISNKLARQGKHVWRKEQSRSHWCLQFAVSKVRKAVANIWHTHDTKASSCRFLDI